MKPLCRIQLFGGLRALLPDGRVVDRFQTRKTGLLLAYLVLHSDSSHPRESLMELLWPEDEPGSSRHKLRMALSALRRQLEPPGIPTGAVILADRFSAGVNRAYVVSDVGEFECALRLAGQCTESGRRTSLLEEAEAIYCGEFLPGHYEDWVLQERDRLTESHLSALRGLMRHFVAAGAHERALQFARKAVEVDPLREELHRDLMRVLAASGQPSAALLQFRRLEETFRTELASAPSTATIALAKQLCDRSAKVGAIPQMAHPQVPRARAIGQESESGARAPIEPPRLPIYLDRFFGRETEIESLVDLLTPGESARSRLVTLVGPGGSGKTRLAIEVAQRIACFYPESVWFCGLADLSDAARIPDALRSALRLPSDPGIDPLTQVCGFLGERPACILLDNFEHLIQDGPPIVRSLLEQASGLTVLATSRCPLGLSGEREITVAPLPLPERDVSPEQLVQFASVRMFVDRAQAVRADFQVTPRLAPVVAAVCRRLEGIPLAIELAAARANMFTLAQIRDGLHDRFGLLVSRKRDIPIRHRSLRAAIEWSYRLLTPEIQRFFNRLSVFSGGWSVEAAHAVCEEQKAAEYVAQLCECSLVTAYHHEDDTRFSMLETLGGFAREQLTQEEWAGLARRHAAYYVNLAENPGSRNSHFSQAEWLDRLAAGYGNFCAVLDRSADGSDDSGRHSVVDEAKESGSMVDCGLRMAVSLHWFWVSSGRVREGRDFLKRLLSAAGPEVCTVSLRQSLSVAASLASFQADTTAARDLSLEALAMARRLGDPAGIAQALNAIGCVASEHGEYADARMHLDESVAILREIGDQANCARTLDNLADTMHRLGDFQATRSLLEENMQLWRIIHSPGSAAFTLGHIAILAESEGDPHTSLTLHQEALTMKREAGDRWGIAESLCHLGYFHWRQRDLGSAQTCWNEAMEISNEFGDRALTSDILCGLGLAASDRQDFRTARARLLESLSIRQQLQQKPRIAFSLDAAAYVAHCGGRADRAARLFGAAASLWDSMGALPSALGRGDYRRDIEAARTKLGHDAFKSAWNQGARMSIDQAVAYALCEETESRH